MIGLNAVIVSVTGEVPRVLVVRRPGHAMAAGSGRAAADAASDGAPALPFGPFTPDRHRTLELGLREWVSAQTGLELGYVEQLYTFGDRYRDPREIAGGPRVVSVSYLALVRDQPLSGSGEAQWRDWYEFLPWEDWRDRRPLVLDQIIRPALTGWVEATNDPGVRARRAERVFQTFDLDDPGWDGERVLERHELLYECGLVAEARRDAQVEGRPCADKADALPGAGMALDHRRILATAMGRLRGKLKYRPLVFELLPEAFTLFRLQQVVEALSGVRLHKQNFRRLLVANRLVEPTGRRVAGTGGRPAELFAFRREVLHERRAPGIGVPLLRQGLD
ncbi:MAG: hypothetical protein H6843_12580 [Rhodospirillaceae bacterium]|nr:hypothetical protein [Rhodospirillaceae bacterium]